MKTRANRKIAINWAAKVAKPNSSLMISDQFWAPFNDESEIRTAVRKLAGIGILVFQGPGREGAILIHKNNPKLAVVNVRTDKTNEDNLYGGSFTNDVEGENNVSVLMPWQFNFVSDFA